MKIKKTILASTLALFLSVMALNASAQRSAGETIDDSTITGTVKLKLIDDETVPAGSINVESYKGTVQLIGYARSEDQKKRALEVARQVNGVEEVEDAILIVPEKRSFGTTIDDQALQTKVKLETTNFGAGKVFSVITDVRNGEVLLGGFVSSDEVRDEMGKAVAGIKGVKKVHNRLAVKR